MFLKLFLLNLILAKKYFKNIYSLNFIYYNNNIASSHDVQKKKLLKINKISENEKK